MKQFYTKHFEIYWKGLWIRPFRLRETIKYLAPEEAQTVERQYTNFKNFYIEMCGMSSWGFEQKQTFFRKRPYILVEEAPLDGYQFRITEKNFRPLKTRWIYEELHTSITQLARYAKSDDFISYCADRGLEFRKVLKFSSTDPLTNSQECDIIILPNEREDITNDHRT
jgi:hypothetical protein